LSFAFRCRLAYNAMLPKVALRRAFRQVFLTRCRTEGAVESVRYLYDSRGTSQEN
jgi:hypothetical protein